MQTFGVQQHFCYTSVQQQIPGAEHLPPSKQAPFQGGRESLPEAVQYERPESYAPETLTRKQSLHAVGNQLGSIVSLLPQILKQMVSQHNGIWCIAVEKLVVIGLFSGGGPLEAKESAQFRTCEPFDSSTTLEGTLYMQQQYCASLISSLVRI